MIRFALIGAAGYVAPRHLKAIKDTGNTLIAALDKSDSVGILDSYYPDASFFTEFERFDRYLSKIKREGNPIDYISICSPNYLHDAHIRFALRIGANVICEKPLVLNPWNLNALRYLEKESGKKINTILQLRLHPAIQAFKEKINRSPKNKIHEIELTYITSRGKWYNTSWKGEEKKSGGIATNIGVHFFDMLSWIFGEFEENIVHLHTHDRAAGILSCKRARIKWFLSTNYDTLPVHIKANNIRTYRSFTMDGEEVEFSNGFKDLHTRSYEQAFAGNGFGLDTVASSINIISQIRNSHPIGLTNDCHPFAHKPLSIHPFKREDMVEAENVNFLK